MLFNSYEFLLLFLPVALLGWHWAGRWGFRAGAMLWLLVCSLFFYAWWNPPYLALLLGTLAINYSLCRLIDVSKGGRRKSVLVLTVGFNLVLLGYFKYAAFLTQNLAVLGWSVPDSVSMVLPLGISFFTFQQLAFAVDVYRGEPAERRPGMFALVVAFFPHLIAGPIVHPRKFLPQFDQHPLGGIRAVQFAPGLALFVMGLSKKMIIADAVAGWASPVFDAPSTVTLTFLDSWTAALSYTLQIYFDFSGYSDMAIGLGWMFGLRIPFNFNSPYQATSLVDFWRRWHMTLSELLRDYVYIPLGGNRKGPWRRHVNLMLTMLIGGLWHGAGWTYVLWGGCHGLGLVINHLWTNGHVRPKSNGRNLLGWTTTFLVIVVTWVLFRSATVERAGDMLAAMAGFNGFSLPPSYVAWIGQLGLDALFPCLTMHSRWMVYEGVEQVAVLLLLILGVKLLPNTQEVMGLVADERKGAGQHLKWRPNLVWAGVLALAWVLCLLRMAKTSEFLYFQF